MQDSRLQLIEDPERRERQVRNALAFVQDYSWEKNQSLYLDAVSKLLKPREVKQYGRFRGGATTPELPFSHAIGIKIGA